MSLKNPTDRLRTNTLQMLFTIVIFIAVAGYFTVAITTRDAFWFLKGFYDLPVEVDVYHDGQKTRYVPGREGYDELAEGVRASLHAGVRQPAALGLSPGSLEDAYNMYVSVEAIFAAPVKLHAWFNTGNPTQLLFPITGRHSDRPIVFLAYHQSAYVSTPPILNTKEPLIQALQKLGYATTSKE